MTWIYFNDWKTAFQSLEIMVFPKIDQLAIRAFPATAQCFNKLIGIF